MKVLLIGVLVLGATSAFGSETVIVKKSMLLSEEVKYVEACEIDKSPVTFDNETWVPDDIMVGENVISRRDTINGGVDDQVELLTITPNVYKHLTYKDYLIERTVKKSGKIISEKIIEGSFSEPYKKLSIETVKLEAVILNGPFGRRDAVRNLLLQCQHLGMH